MRILGKNLEIDLFPIEKIFPKTSFFSQIGQLAAGLGIKMLIFLGNIFPIAFDSVYSMYGLRERSLFKLPPAIFEVPASTRGGHFPSDLGGGRFSERFMGGGPFSERFRWDLFSHRKSYPIHIKNDWSLT